MTIEKTTRFDDIAEFLSEADQFQLAMTRVLLEETYSFDVPSIIHDLQHDQQALTLNVNAHCDKHSRNSQAVCLLALYGACIWFGVETYPELGLGSVVFVLINVALLVYAVQAWIAQRMRKTKLKKLLPGLEAASETVELNAIQGIVKNYRADLAPYALPTEVKDWTMREYLIAFLVLD